MIREPVEEEDDGANGEDRTESGVRPSLPVRVLTFQNLQSPKSFFAPISLETHREAASWRGRRLSR